MTKRALIFDIDSTLGQPDERLIHVQSEPKNWDAFFSSMGEDRPIEAVVLLAQIAHKHAQSVDDFSVLISTARPDKKDYRAITEAWLARHGVAYDALYMRRGGDFRRDDIVKAEIIQQMVEDGYTPLLAIDDKANVCSMYRSYGIIALQCADDETRRSKYAGQTLLDMMVGPSGAGKSTYIAANYKPHDVVSTDALREQLFGSHTTGGHSPEELARTWKLAHGLIKARLDAGVFTVLDATNLRKRDRRSVLDLVPEGVMVNYVVIDREFDSKLASRGWRPESLVTKHHNTFKAQLKDILRGDDLPNVFVRDKREHKV